MRAALVFHADDLTHFGLYERDRAGQLQLQFSQKSAQKTITALSIFQENLHGKINFFCYGRGPGSLTAIKLIHIFCHTLAFLHASKILAVNTFALNGGAPITAFGEKVFVRENEKIALKNRDNLKKNEIFLPQILNLEIFCEPATPLYVLPAVSQPPR